MAKKYQQTLKNNQIIHSKPLVQQAEIKNNLTVLPELEDLIPPLKEDEFKQLETNIVKEGCREALLVWEQENAGNNKYILIDGHNRYRICKEHSIDYRVHLIHFDSLKQVKEYMIDNQLGRRNLTKEQASFLRGMRFNNEKIERGKYDRSQKPQNGVFDQLKTSERLAQEYKVSKNTIERDAEFALGLEKIGSSSPELKKSILAGSTKVSKSKIQQLAKIDNPGLLLSVDDINKVILKRIPRKPPLPIPDTKQRRKEINESKSSKVIKLKKNLTSLCHKIQEAEQPHHLIDELIEQAKQLKALIS